MHPLLCWSPHLNIADCGHSPPLMGLSMNDQQLVTKNMVQLWESISIFNIIWTKSLYVYSPRAALERKEDIIHNYTIDNLFSACNTCLRLLAPLKSAMIFLLSQVINNYHWIQYWWQWLLSVWLLYRKYWNDCVKVAINHVVASGKTQEMSK